MPPAHAESTPSHAEMLLIALLAAPVVGWAAMGVLWFLVVDTALRGGPDLGVVLAGSLVAALVTAACGAVQRASATKLVVWPAAALLVTFAVAAAIVIPMSSGFDAGFD